MCYGEELQNTDGFEQEVREWKCFQSQLDGATKLDESVDENTFPLISKILMLLMLLMLIKATLVTVERADSSLKFVKNQVYMI